MIEGFEPLLDWAWARHHNEWSWYIRPVFVLAFCAASWFRKPFLIVSLAVFFPLSAVIFPAPEHPKPHVVEFLLAERQLLEALTAVQFATFVLAVSLFLTLLAAAFWKRNLWLGVLVANLGGAAKLLFGYWAWGETGSAAILPTLVTAFVFNAICYMTWRLRRQSVKNSMERIKE